jgi:hypothetical protein
VRPPPPPQPPSPWLPALPLRRFCHRIRRPALLPDRRGAVSRLCVRLYKDFEITWHKQKHTCLAFEKLGCSLYGACTACYLCAGEARTLAQTL